MTWQCFGNCGVTDDPGKTETAKHMTTQRQPKTDPYGSTTDDPKECADRVVEDWTLVIITHQPETVLRFLRAWYSKMEFRQRCLYPTYIDYLGPLDRQPELYAFSQGVRLGITAIRDLIMEMK